MTVREAYNSYSPSKFVTSIGDNINRVCYQIYQSLDTKYIQILTELNIRVDWDYIKPGAEILYFNKWVCDQIDL